MNGFVLILLPLARRWFPSTIPASSDENSSQSVLASIQANAELTQGELSIQGVPELLLGRSAENGHNEMFNVLAFLTFSVGV